MKKLITMLFILLSISIQAQFTVVQTKLVDPGGLAAAGGSSIFTAFTNPGDNGVGKDLPSAFGVLAGQENVIDRRIQNGAIVEASTTISPLQQGDILTSKVFFYAYFKDVFDEACQIIVHNKILYEVRNDGGVAADLHYGINPNVRYREFGDFSSIQGFSIKLRESEPSGIDGAIIYNSGYIRANMNNPIRGTAYANVPAGATRYVLLDIWVSAFSLHQSAMTIFSVDGSQGIAVGFDNEAIPMADGLDNDPFIDVKAKLKFQLHNFFADPNNGPNMGLTGATAFTEFNWLDNVSDAYGIAENTGILANVDGITVTMDDFEIVDFDPMAEVNVGAGSAGDRRTYINGVAKIYKDGVLKMQVDDCRIALNVNYPAPFGTGSETTGGGWGRISTLNTDPAWFAEFDENQTQQVEFVFYSLSNVINNPFYDAVIAIVPSEYRDDYVGWQVGAAGGIVENVDSVGIAMNFRNVGEAGSAYARLLRTNPGGALPGGIQSISNSRFWELGATFSSFNVDVGFDLTGLSGLTDMNKVRILHRELPSDPWTILDPDTYTIAGSRITVAGISDFSQFGVGSTEEDLTPVELTSFIATESNAGVILNWKTATEVNNHGFEVERFGDTWKSIGFVDGHGNSNSPQEYSFVDLDRLSGAVQYRLKQIDNDGGFEYSNVVIVEMNVMAKTELHQNYPNPFNPSTQISYSLAKAGTVNISVYNTLGQKVAELVNGKMNTGTHNVEFNANNFASGLYFYKLETPNYSKTMKMLLVK